MGVIADRLRALVGVPTSQHKADPGPLRGTESLAEASHDGSFAGSGESRAGWFPPDAGFGQTRAILPVDGAPANLSGDLTPVATSSLGRGQRHIIAMPDPSPEYREAPAFDGHHAEVVNRPYVVGVAGADMEPWGDTPPTSFRQVPPTDAGNPAPSNCGPVGR